MRIGVTPLDETAAVPETTPALASERVGGGGGGIAGGDGGAGAGTDGGAGSNGGVEPKSGRSWLRAKKRIAAAGFANHCWRPASVSGLPGP